MSSVVKPRVLFLCDKKDWAFDIVAHNLIAQLKGKYQFTVKYVRDSPSINEEEYDIIYVFFWGERYHKKFVTDASKIVKEISSHRWEKEEKYGKHTSQEAFDRYMSDASVLVATSERLRRSFEDVSTDVLHYPLGIDPKIFKQKTTHKGLLRVGWAGNMNDAKKGVKEVLIPACREKGIELLTAGGDKSIEEMVGFYQSLDIICVASTEEGTPLPLIEAMACGCFPICTDVGIVPEIITHQDNGLIVDRSIEGFIKALNWCEKNTDFVRDKGVENSNFIRTHRTWENSATFFDEVMQTILRKHMEPYTDQPTTKIDDPYYAHFKRINPGGYSDSSYKYAKEYLTEDIEALLPESKDAKILEIGTGFGHLIRFLTEQRYTRVSALDMSPGLLDGVKVRYADKLEKAILADAREYLPTMPDSYDLIIMMDVIEHMPLSDAKELLLAVYKALKVGGKVIMRTPNMGNIMGQYSFYQDITHDYCYTDWSMIHLLELCDFSQVDTYQVREFASSKRKRYAKINKVIHDFIYRINDKVPPKTVSKNLIAWGIK